MFTTLFNNNNNNNNPNILLIGSGWSARGFIDSINTQKYNVTVISKNLKFLYTPLLANYCINKGIKNIDNDISTDKSINLMNNSVTDVNFEIKQIICNDKKIFNYDYVVFSHGSIINTFNIDGVAKNCYFLKSKDDADNIYDKISKLSNNKNISIIGCGLTGTELIGNLIDSNKFNINAIDGLSGPIQMFSNKNIDKTIHLWDKNNVNMIFNKFVNKIDDKYIYYNDGKINYDIAIWCGGIKISPLSVNINNKLGLISNRGIPVNKFLEINKNSFAIGDCADSGFPPSAQNAYQQGNYLAKRFNNDFNDNIEYDFFDKGKLCYIGNYNSIYENNLFSISGKIGHILGKIIHFYNN